MLPKASCRSIGQETRDYLGGSMNEGVGTALRAFAHPSYWSWCVAEFG
jgi:hypothetical protein